MNKPAPIPDLTVPIGKLIDRIDHHLENMVAIEMERLPSHWSEADRREIAEKAIFGRNER